MRPQFFACAVLVALSAVLAGCGGGGSASDDAASAIDAGWKYFSDGEYSLAMKEFESAGALAPRDALRTQEALFGQAITWHVRTRPENSPDKARAAYTAAIDLCPTNDIAAWADLWRARLDSEVVQGEYPPAEKRFGAYDEVAKRHPSHPAGEEAFLCTQAILLEQDSEEVAASVRDAIVAWLAAHPESGWRQTAYGLLSTCARRLDDMQGIYDNVVKSWEARYVNPDHPNDDPQLIDWTLASIAEFDVGDLEAAARHYRAFIERYPTHQRVFIAIQELARIEEMLGKPAGAEEADHE